MMGGVCLSVCLTIARIDLSREQKGLRSPKVPSYKAQCRKIPEFGIRMRIQITIEIECSLSLLKIMNINLQRFE